jgi:hypothetical protein
MLKNKCCLYVIISIRFFSITICNLLIELPSYNRRLNVFGIEWNQQNFKVNVYPEHISYAKTENRILFIRK